MARTVGLTFPDKPKPEAEPVKEEPKPETKKKK